ncbi:hypothetical protein QAD02_022619 [Eretmocerus hayati]|uniref:Uncharacterized protein n=1 Tax=Eretmocerus hayati TaxID=131215 RepID=A0ACC2PTU0_9HYME|nr:hypothetical protein QAD02_022619 [Eretmocerus hayati]
MNKIALVMIIIHLLSVLDDVWQQGGVNISNQSSYSTKYFEKDPLELSGCYIGTINKRRKKTSNPDRNKDYASCVYCGKTYTLKRSLWRHQKYECTGLARNPRFRCAHCNQTCKLKYNMKAHLAKVHPEKPAEYCMDPA